MRIAVVVVVFVRAHRPHSQASIGSLINNQQLQGADRQKPGASSAKDNIGMAIIRKVIP